MHTFKTNDPNILLKISYFESLAVLGQSPNVKTSSSLERVVLRCKCGTKFSACLKELRRTEFEKLVKSCGCLKSILSTVTAKTHGLSNSLTMSSWGAMKSRCKAQHVAHSNYYDRGIDYDPRWEIFSNFLEDMGERESGKELDRVDNAKGYFKENCRWVTRTENARNRRNSVSLVFKEERRPLKEISELTGLKYTTLLYRLKAGWHQEDLYKPSTNSPPPIPKSKNLSYN
jgi:hypothetical protein